VLVNRQQSATTRLADTARMPRAIADVMRISILFALLAACARFEAAPISMTDAGPISMLPSGDSFRASVCSCADITVHGDLTVTADPANATGGVGANGQISLDGSADSSGSIKAATQVVGAHDSVKTGRDLVTAGPLDVASSFLRSSNLDVGGSALVGGDLMLRGRATIAGDLVQPAGSATPDQLTVGGTRQIAPVDVVPPCACGSSVRDIAGEVAQARTANDNAALGLDPASTTAVSGTVDLTLPDGRYYLDEVSGAGAIDLHITGHAVAFVAGDVNATGTLSVAIDPGAQLELSIAGDLRSIGGGALGPSDRPGAVRVYVAGSGDITLGAAAFVGNLYAPHARIVGGGATSMLGSLFGASIDISGNLRVGYDASVQGGDPLPF
jgi:hypothetical protein